MPKITAKKGSVGFVTAVNSQMARVRWPRIEGFSLVTFE